MGLSPSILTARRPPLAGLGGRPASVFAGRPAGHVVDTSRRAVAPANAIAPASDPTGLSRFTRAGAPASPDRAVSSAVRAAMTRHQQTLARFGQMSVPSGTNTFVPNADLSAEITIDFARDPKKMPVSRYSMLVPNQKQRIGYYKRIAPDQNARVRYNDMRAFAWPDAADRPSGASNQKLFENVRYETQRFDVPWVLGELAIEQADFALESVYAAMVAQQSMTGISLATVAALEAADWASVGHAIDVPTLLGEYPTGHALAGEDRTWKNGNAKSPNIRETLLAAEIRIDKATYGAVTGADLTLVMNPTTAAELGVSEELFAVFANSALSEQLITRGMPLMERGLPEVLYGHPVVIDNTVWEPTPEPDPQSGLTQIPLEPTYTIPDGVVYLLSTKNPVPKNENVSPVGVPVMATVVRVSYGPDMNYESMYDERNRRYEGHVVLDFDIQITSVLTAVRLANVYGTP